MKKQLISSKKIKLNSRIVLKFDNLYKNKYDTNYFSRQALLEFFYYIQHIEHYDDSFKTCCIIFSNHNIRCYSPFKRKIEADGKRVYELDRIIKCFIEDGIIVKLRNYSNYEGQKFCNVYSFTEEFELFRKESAIINKQVELNVGDSKLMDELENLSKTDKDTKHQLKVMMDKNYTIDIKEAQKIINSLCDDTGKPYSTTVKYYMEILIYNFNNKVNLYSKRGHLVDRIFTTFCAFKKDIRAIVKYKGEYLSSIDLRSTMPYLLFHEYQNENEDMKSLYNSIVNEDIYNKILLWQQTQPNFKEVKLHTYIKNGKEESYPEFITLDNSKINRDLIKVHFMRYLYCTTMKSNTIVKNYIKTNFPQVNSFLIEKKKQLKNENKTLTQFLTSKEVDIFIPTGNSFNNVLTLHDCLYFPKDITNDVLNKLESRFKELGYSNYKLHIE